MKCCYFYLVYNGITYILRPSRYSHIKKQFFHEKARKLWIIFRKKVESMGIFGNVSIYE